MLLEGRHLLLNKLRSKVVHVIGLDGKASSVEALAIDDMVVLRFHHIVIAIFRHSRRRDRALLLLVGHLFLIKFRVLKPLIPIIQVERDGLAIWHLSDCVLIHESLSFLFLRHLADGGAWRVLL